MKVAVFINQDLYGCMALNFLIPCLQQHQVWLGCSTHVGKRAAADSAVDSAINPMLQTLRFHEQILPTQILFPKLEAAGLHGRGEWLTINQAAQTHGWPVTLIESLGAPGLLDSVRRFAPDAMISIRFGKIFKHEWLHLARHGILNLHSGLLPEYRGVLATFWTLLQRRAEYGCTLHWIDDGTIDTGGAIESIRMPVVPGKSLISHILELYQPGVAAMTRALDQLAQGRRPAGVAQQGNAQYFSYPTVQDYAAFLAQGGTVMDYEDYARVLRKFGPGLSEAAGMQQQSDMK